MPPSAFLSSLSYYDGCVAARGPANLLQALRNYFGVHTYRRLDAEGSLHTRRGQDSKEVPIR
jgi:6-phosphogluconate dehydrogenase